MIIVQTPLRISFFGGGTDFPSYYLKEGGCVLSSAINKYIFVIIKERFDSKLRIGWTQTELVNTVDEIQHELIRESLRMTGIERGVEIITMGDIPATGSGLGSSGAVTVGALQAMYTYQRKVVPTEVLAHNACEIEINILNKPVGVQDQYISAYGGLCFMEFLKDGKFIIEKLSLNPKLKRRLNDSLLLFYTGITRKSSDILYEQKENISTNIDILREMAGMTYIARDELKKGNLDIIGEQLHASWELKKQLSNKVTNGVIDSIYQIARKAGAIGGKITGAGGGGFLLLYAPVEKKEHIRSALFPLKELPINLEPDGSKVIFNYL